MTPQIDEKQIRSADLRKLPLLVSKAKSEHLQSRIKEPVILITCDTIVIHDDKLYEKPKDAQEARNMLSSYGSKPAQVLCGVYVVNTATGKSAGGMDSAEVYFHKIPPTLIEEMIEHGKIFDFAGAFHFEDPPIKPYIAYINGEIENVAGLPRFLTKKLIDEVVNG